MVMPLGGLEGMDGGGEGGYHLGGFSRGGAGVEDAVKGPSACCSWDERRD